jgi:DNA invertase Pin-like site-specific DNA recombinase
VRKIDLAVTMTGSVRDQAPRRQRAAQYVRMSTEHQKYSIQNQADAIARYAERRGFEIVSTYEDSGKSGLRIEGRGSLQRLIADVWGGTADFTDILVYDVSRWGRFQDADESAYYEFMCRKAGVAVHYCAEQFENDGSIGATLMKSIKRVMAGEYSRELSVKIFAGQSRQVRLGFRAGSRAGYGMRRMMVDQHGRPKAMLGPGEQKSMLTDHVILVPGPPHEVAMVRRIYQMFVSHGVRESGIVVALNDEGLRTDRGGPWTQSVVRQILRGEKYIGNNVYNRRSFKLKGKRTRNPRESWVRGDGAFEAIIEPEIFEAAQRIIAVRSHSYTDQQMLDGLSTCLVLNGKLSALIVDQDEELPHSSVYRRRFGNLLTAYRLIGYKDARDYSYVSYKKLLKQLRSEVIDRLIGDVEARGGFARRDTFSTLSINDEYSTSIMVTACGSTKTGKPVWKMRFGRRRLGDFMIVARLTADNSTILDYYVLPLAVLEARPSLWLGPTNAAAFDAYRFDTLDGFCELVGRSPTPVAG